MAIYTERVQTVLTKEQYKMLAQVAEEKKKPLSVLVREAVQEVYLTEVDRRRRREALDRLLELDAPVADWEEMEAEIIRGATE